MRLLLAVLVASLACHDSSSSHAVQLTRLFPALGSEPMYAACAYASPLWIASQGIESVLVATIDGKVRAVDPRLGTTTWEVDIPSPTGEQVFLVATPVVVEHYVFVAYQHRMSDTKQRTRHRLVAIDLTTRDFATDIPELEISASVPAADGVSLVDFVPKNAISRSALIHAGVPGQPLGRLYLSFANAQDIQPWHGWLFELDLDAWAADGVDAAVTSVLNTTPEIDCGTPGTSGARGMECGGGIWSPAGPLLVPKGDSYEIFVATGNGQLDLNRGDYANTVMRVGPGLAYDSGCDAGLCADFDVLAPTEACLASCGNLFVPRLQPGDPPLLPESGACDGLSFFECYAALDWDLGANAPAYAMLSDGTRVIAVPGKDGALYLMDADHLGTLYDRLKLVEACGTPSQPCDEDWAGMIVTQPAVASVGGEPLFIVPTFEFDEIHEAGVFGVGVELTADGPRLAQRWRAEGSLAAFREHTGRPVVTTVRDESYALVVDATGDTGTLHVINATTGHVASSTPLLGPGRRYIAPLVHNGVAYTVSCTNETDGRLEAFVLK